MKKKIILIIFTLLSLFVLAFFNACNKENEIILNTEGTKMIAHRGLSSLYYQNSEDAFVAAGESKYFYGIETDVRPTLDNKWICSHDDNPFIDKTKLVSTTNYDDALKLPLDPDKKGAAEINKDYYLCSYETYLKTCLKYSKVPIIEIKFKATKEQIQSLISETEKVLRIDKVVFISFEKDNLNLLKDVNKTIKIIILSSNQFIAYPLALKGENIGVSYEILTEDLIKKAHKNDAEVNVWTVNDTVNIEKFTEWGVDYITTDYDFSKP